jgi:MoaA/NifB/PqqE/SkfB family radical SAM enzyme
MKVGDYKKVADQAIKMGYITFSFQGGEPAMDKRLPDIIKCFRPRQHHITITSNGSLLTEEIIKSWADAGVDTIYFSVDSGIPEEHDKLRDFPGSFERIMKAMEWVKKYGMKTAINTVVSTKNLYTEGFKKILDFSHENRIMLETIYARPLGRWSGHEEFMLSQKDIDYYYNIRKNYPFVVRDLDNNYGKWGCPAVKEVLYITPYGDVCGCPYNHISLGNIHDEPLKAIRKRGLSLHWYDHYHYECLTAIDKDFINAYLPLADRDGIVAIKDFENANNIKSPTTN